MTDSEIDPTLSGSPVTPPPAAEYPSLTSIVLVMILVVTVLVVSPNPAGGSLLGGIASLLPILVIGVLVLYLFLSLPDRLIERYHLQPLEVDAPEIARLVHEYSRALGLKQPPRVFSTSVPNVPVQTFSTFRHRYIVLNTVEIEAHRRAAGGPGPDPLAPILVHELAHLRSGDTWKLQLARKIVTAITLFALLQLLSSFDSYSIERLLLGTPASAAAYLADKVSFLAILLIALYILKVMVQAREFYADEVAKQVFDEQRILNSLMWSTAVWANRKNQPSAAGQPGRGLAVPGLAFLADVEFAQERLKALQSGPGFHRVMRKILFGAGLVAAIPTFYLSSGGLELFSGGLILGGSLLGAIYILPYARREKFRHTADLLRVGFQAVLFFLVGALLMLLANLLTTLAAGLLFDLPWPVYAKTAGGLLALGGAALVSGMILAVSLAYAIAVLPRWRSLAERSAGRGMLLFGLLTAQVIAALLLIDSLLAAVLAMTTPNGLVLVLSLLFCAIPYLDHWLSEGKGPARLEQPARGKGGAG